TAGPRLDGEQVEYALLRRIEIVLNRLRAIVQDEVEDHARDGDAEAERRVPHRFGDAVGEDALAVGGGEAGRRHGAGRVDEAEDGSEETEERRDVRERPERADALLDRRLELADLLAHRGVDLVRALVGVREARLHELQRRVVARVAKLDRAVDVSRGHE